MFEIIVGTAVVIIALQLTLMNTYLQDIRDIFKNKK